MHKTDRWEAGPRPRLTGVNEKLVGDPRMVHIMDGAGKDGSQDFQVCENGLSRCEA